MTESSQFASLDAAQVISANEALTGRTVAVAVEQTHHSVLETPLEAIPEGYAVIVFGLGCFWGAERLLWQLADVYSTAVGYAAGITPNPTYEEVCTGKTGHAEVVRVVYKDQPQVLQALLTAFWESHDPTQGMRQGNDSGTQYRSIILCTNDHQRRVAESSRLAYQACLRSEHLGEVTTQIGSLSQFYWAETYHQQYLAKNPNGYCGLGGTGVCFLETEK